LSTGVSAPYRDSRLGAVGFDLTAVFPAPHDQPDPLAGAALLRVIGGPGSTGQINVNGR